MTTSSCVTTDGHLLQEGDTVELDKCTFCICHNGGLLCAPEMCPPILCHQPYYKNNNSCCPVCPGLDSSNAKREINL